MHTQACVHKRVDLLQHSLLYITVVLITGRLLLLLLGGCLAWAVGRMVKRRAQRSFLFSHDTRGIVMALPTNAAQWQITHQSTLLNTTYTLSSRIYSSKQSVPNPTTTTKHHSRQQTHIWGCPPLALGHKITFIRHIHRLFQTSLHTWQGKAIQHINTTTSCVYRARREGTEKIPNQRFAPQRSHRVQFFLAKATKHSVNFIYALHCSPKKKQ